MKPKWLILSLLLLAFCFSCLLSFTLRKAASPVTISLLINDDSSPTALRGRIFHFNNLSSTPMNFTFDIKATNSVTGRLWRTDGRRSLKGNGSSKLGVYFPENTNDWHITATIAATGPKPEWERGLETIARRVGLHITSLAGNRSFAPVTNSWNQP